MLLPATTKNACCRQLSPACTVHLLRALPRLARAIRLPEQSPPPPCEQPLPRSTIRYGTYEPVKALLQPAGEGGGTGPQVCAGRLPHSPALRSRGLGRLRGIADAAAIYRTLSPCRTCRCGRKWRRAAWRAPWARRAPPRQTSSKCGCRRQWRRTRLQSWRTPRGRRRRPASGAPRRTCGGAGLCCCGGWGWWGLRGTPAPRGMAGRPRACPRRACADAAAPARACSPSPHQA